MSKHPAYLMIGTWLGCVLLLWALPFELLGKTLSPYGIFVFTGFLLSFVLGSLLVPRFRQVAGGRADYERIDFSRAERLLAIASVIASLAFLMDIFSQDLFSVMNNQEMRAERADALLNGRDSVSSVWFKVAFLMYPAAYVYIAGHILYARKLVGWRMVAFGFLPLLLGIMAMGGRAPLFYGMCLAALAWSERRKYFSDIRKGWKPRVGSVKSLLVIGIVFAAVALSAYYFAVVFFVRGEAVGGPAGMFQIARTEWGVGFNGFFSTTIFSIFGENLTYLIFVFSWYLVQGLIMASHIFTGYEGPAQMGIYGIDIVSAIMRRVDPDRVTNGFQSLLSLGTYGFLPSAFGSLYIDFGVFGLLLTAAWGYLAGLVYRKIQAEKNSRWLLFGPFVTMGIFFSLINTPIGFSNGFITHLWMGLAFFLLRFVKQQEPATLAFPA